jgi:hypothetical protein
MWFEETGHNICDQSPDGGFKTYWQTHGLQTPGLSAYARSLQLFGLPLTVAQMETNSSGETVLTQWFERARFEWHPANPQLYRVLLGLIGHEMASAGPSQPAFGVQISAGQVGAVNAQAADAGSTWVRYDGVQWSAVEPTPGARAWQNLASAESELQLLTTKGFTPLVIVRGTPAWAQQLAGHPCAPIKPEALDAFATFMHDTVARYSQPPYRIHYWEIWNEPDVPTSVAENSPFGCWGDPNDQYYGGGAFAEMLKRIYPAIKQADPAAQVVLGGLLLDCDPNRPPEGKDCRSAHFLEGLLRSGGGSAFDILAYHSYAYWGPAARDWDQNFGNWAASGGQVLGKLAFLRGVLARYNIGKPIMSNEASLLCIPNCPRQQYDPSQANYVIRLYTRAWANQLFGVLWYTLDGPGWRDSSLLDAAQAPRPGYQALKFLTTLLKGAEYTGSFSNGPLEGYMFRKGATIYRIGWTNDGSAVTLPLPKTPAMLYNKLGQARPPAGASVEFGHEPVLVVSDS